MKAFQITSVEKEIKNRTEDASWVRNATSSRNQVQMPFLSVLNHRCSWTEPVVPKLLLQFTALLQIGLSSDCM